MTRAFPGNSFDPAVIIALHKQHRWVTPQLGEIMQAVRRIASARAVLASSLLAVVLLTSASTYTADPHTTKAFTGIKVNGGTATHSKQGGQSLLTLSSDFKVPDAPAPHWQVVDSKGNVYLLQRLVVKGDKFNQSITVPSYVPDIAKVQIWCAWAETLLGEAPFEAPVK